MVSLTLSVPPQLKKRMEKHAKIKWSEVVRAVLTQQLDDLEEADRLASKSRLTQKDVDALAEKADADVAKRWKEIVREAGR